MGVLLTGATAPGATRHDIAGMVVETIEQTDGRWLYSEKTLIPLRLLTATAFNYALCSPLIYLSATNLLFQNGAMQQGSVVL